MASRCATRWRCRDEHCRPGVSSRESPSGARRLDAAQRARGAGVPRPLCTACGRRLLTAASPDPALFAARQLVPRGCAQVLQPGEWRLWSHPPLGNWGFSGFPTRIRTVRAQHVTRDLCAKGRAVPRGRVPPRRVCPAHRGLCPGLRCPSRRKAWEPGPRAVTVPALAPGHFPSGTGHSVPRRPQARAMFLLTPVGRPLTAACEVPPVVTPRLSPQLQMMSGVAHHGNRQLIGSQPTSGVGGK